MIHHRAVDNQIYVAMCSPARHMEASYHAVRPKHNMQLLGLTDAPSPTVRSFDGRQADVSGNLCADAIMC